MVLALKLFFLGVRQISKPLAGLAKSAATESPLFQQAVISAGQSVHRLRIQVSRVAENKSTLAKITPLSEQRAIAQGSDLLSESIIYSIAGFTVVYEYRLQKRDKASKELAEAAAEAKRRQEMQANEERQWAQFRHLEQRISLLQDMVWTLETQCRTHEELQRQQQQEQQQRRRWWL